MTEESSSQITRRAVDALLDEVEKHLPEELKFTTTPSTRQLTASHPLAFEVEAIREGQSGSLPYFNPKGGVVWFTLAPSSQELHRAYADLRAWIFPSLGWEDPDMPIVSASAARGALGALIAAISPAGYVRWHGTKAGFDRMLRRLRQMRQLQRRRPVRVSMVRPSLFELRHRFQIALEIGDKDAATAALQMIDIHQLDSAVNTGFMRLRWHAAFSDDCELVTDPALPRLLQMHLPTRVREAVLAAHHRFYLEALEAASDFDGAVAHYYNDLDEVIGQHVAILSMQDTASDCVLARLAGYRCALQGRNKLLAEIAAQHPTDIVLAALRRRAVPSETDHPSPHATAKAGDSATSIIIDSANPLKDKLTWSQLTTAFREQRWTDVDEFLLTVSGAGGPVESESWTLAPLMSDALLELATLPDVLREEKASQQFDRVILAAVDISEPGLSRPEYKSTYTTLLSIWSERRSESAYPPDGHLLLALVDAVLTHEGARREAEAVAALRSWWTARPVRARLSWLLDALDLLSEKGAAPGSVSYNASTALWLDGADLIRRDPAAVSPTEIELWRRIGGRLDFDAGSIVEYLGPVPSEGTPVLDPLKSLSAQRIAIVTLQERAAEVARELLRKRSEAEFVLVCEHVPGPATAAARSADVILFAWAANKHAVYNAFQDARDRLVYVPGKGASSIIRTLEQWVRKRSEPASTVQ